ncbi:MAG: SCO1664 family protein [Actinomycetota bacterium]
MKRTPFAPAGTVELLETGQLHVLGLIPQASNSTFLAEVSLGDRRELAVYKPRRGETPLWDFPEGTLCNREVAAYEVARELGWPAVPPTVLRDGPHGEGSVQLFVDSHPEQHYFTLRDSRLDEFLPGAAFDVVVGNGDRKAGHCLSDGDGVIWFVDHGLCFHPTPWLRTVIWDFAGQPVPESLLADLRRVEGELRGGALRGRLLELLAPEEVDAAADRTADLVAAGTYPLPGPGRSHPWPAV